MNINDIIIAENRIKKHIYNTPIIRLKQLDNMLGCKVYIKAENMQITNSFKIRGAINKFLINKDTFRNGVVATSSGSHGLAVAYSAKLFNIPATIILRDTAPSYKINLIKKLGAQVITLPFHLRYDKAQEFVKDKGYTYIHPYEDEEIIAGHGTVALEILNQGDFNKVLIPMGGGGIAAGTAFTIKTLCPNCEVIGCEPSVISKFSKSLKENKPISVNYAKSVADSLLPLSPGVVPFKYINEYLNFAIPVDEDNILKAQKILLEQGKIVSEVSSAIVIGAVLQKPEIFNSNEKVCFVISGGNIDYKNIY